jgi:hypothetical protein
MKYANLWERAAGGTAALALVLAGAAGCSGSEKSADAATGPSAATGIGPASAAPGTSAAGPGQPSATASPVLPDGRSAVYLTGLDAGTATFDLIEFLTGDKAEAEWKKQHPDSTEGPDNGYLIVNDNTKLRTLPVAADAKCLVLASQGSTDKKTISFAALPASIKQQNKGLTLTPPHITALPFWLTVQNGKVVKFEEQFLP